MKLMPIDGSAGDPGSAETVLALLPLVSRIAADLERARGAALALLAQNPSSVEARWDRKVLNRFLNELDNVGATLGSYRSVRAEFAGRMTSSKVASAPRSRGMLRARAG
jgi:hypothetical protein